MEAEPKKYLTVASFLALTSEATAKMMLGQELIATGIKVRSVSVLKSGEYRSKDADGRSEQVTGYSPDRYWITTVDNRTIEVRDHFTLEVRPCNSK